MPYPAVACVPCGLSRAVGGREGVKGVLNNMKRREPDDLQEASEDKDSMAGLEERQGKLPDHRGDSVPGRFYGNEGNSSPLTVFSLFLIATMLPLLLSFTTIFMLTALLLLLIACLPCSHGLAAQDLSLPLTPILSISLMQELTSILSLSTLSLVNSVTLSLLLYFHLFMT